MTRNIHLSGEMGQLFGTKWRLNCKTIQEAMHAIDCMKGGMRRYLTDCTENGVGFTVQKGEDFLDNQTVGLELGKDDLIITPIPAGSRRRSKGGSIAKIVIENRGCKHHAKLYADNTGSRNKRLIPIHLKCCSHPTSLDGTFG